MTEVIDVLLITQTSPSASNLLLRLNEYKNPTFRVQVETAWPTNPDILPWEEVDLILLDLDLAGESGMSLLKTLQERHVRRAALLIITSCENEDLAVQLVRLGAQAYILKEDSTDKYLLPMVVQSAKNVAARQQIIRLQKALQVAQAEERDCAKFKSDFLANISHEIRTPMNALIGMTDLLRRSPLNREQEKFIEIIQRAGSDLLEVIDDILTFSRLEGGRFGLRNEVFDLRKMIESAVDQLAEKARGEDLYFATFVSPALPAMVEGDPHRLKEVLLDLATNAINFSELGKIELRVTLAELQGNQVGVTFCISDSVGSLAHSQRRAVSIPLNFDPQKSIEKSSSGLGLAVAKRIVHRMGGKVSFENSSDKGAKTFFTVRLSIASTNKNYGPSEAGELQRKLLLGNLHPLDQEVLSEYAHCLGIQCDVVSSWEAILEQTSSLTEQGERYHLVIIDLSRSADESASANFLTQLARHNIEIAIIRPTEEVELLEKVFDLQIAHKLDRPLKQTQFAACLNDALSSENEDSFLEKEARDQGDLLKTAKFDLRQGVLVVEDNQVNREVAKLQLKNLGLNPVMVSGGAQALQELSKCHYQFILMDCNMPTMDGYETTRRIREMQKNANNRSTIIALTANVLPGDREKCIAAGMDDFLSKPVTIEKLGHMLLKWQAKQEQRQEKSQHEEESPFSSEENWGKEELSNKSSDDLEIENDIENELDLSIIKKQLTTTYGDGPGSSIFELFCSSTPDLIKQLESACNMQDWTTLSNTAHELKGQCSIVQADKLARMCKELEQIIKSHERESIERILKKLRESYEKAKVNQLS